MTYNNSITVSGFTPNCRSCLKDYALIWASKCLNKLEVLNMKFAWLSSRPSMLLLMILVRTEESELWNLQNGSLDQMIKAQLLFTCEWHTFKKEGLKLPGCAYPFEVVDLTLKIKQSMANGHSGGPSFPFLQILTVKLMTCFSCYFKLRNMNV